jgi:hypothetical protein
MAFLIALVRHAARHYGENARELLGPPAQGTHEDVFIDAFNTAAPLYADFDGEAPARRSAAAAHTPAATAGGSASEPAADSAPAPADEGFNPGFAYVRFFAGRVEAHLPVKDQRWVIDQLMALEVPDALEIVQRSLRELFDPSPRPRRRATQNGE